MSQVYLRKPQLNDLAEIKQAYQSSIHLHQARLAHIHYAFSKGILVFL